MAIVIRGGHVAPVSSLRKKKKNFSTYLQFSATGILTLGTANPFSGDFYFSSWINWSGPNGSYQHIFSKRNEYGSSTMMFDLYIDPTTSKLSLDTNVGQNDFNHVFPIGQWSHLLWVRDSIEELDTVYVNGNKVASIASDVFGTGTSSLISIGGTQNPAIESFNGSIDESAIGLTVPDWDDAISIYSKQNYPDLWTLLKYDEGSGTTALDSSGNNNNGTLTGSVSYSS